MSTTIDQRVVEMRFDNSHFEKNVSTTMSTLEKFKESLNLTGATKGLENVDATASKVNFSGLSSAVETVQAKFSAMEVIAVTALVNITNSAVNAGKRLVSSLSVDQISAGWAKFANKTQSVGTLISQGYDLDTVNAQLARLNWYTDETSYNFTDMVENISKFTATGKGLKESVAAMEGIANWAALSGQNASTASRAMYQLSQAMSAGYMRLEDYKSIQNASMDTAEFRQKCLDAAVALGTLKKQADGTYVSLVGEGDAFTLSQFTTQLTKGAWMTSDVMMKVFGDYSAAVDQIYEYADEKGITASQAIAELGGNVDAFGLKAFKAAQEARSWADVIDSVKDAVSTGWMNTFEIIFGNYKEATELWTSLANAMYDAFAAGAEDRNTMLEEWKELGGRTALIDTFWMAWDNVGKILGTVKEAFREVFPRLTGKQLFSLTEGLKSLVEYFKMGDSTAANLKATFKGLFSVVKFVADAFLLLVSAIAPLAEYIFKVLDGAISLTGSFAEYVENLTGTIKVSEIFNDVLDNLQGLLSTVSDAVKQLFKNFKPFQTIGKVAKKVIKGISDGISNIIPSFTLLGSSIGDAFNTDNKVFNSNEILGLFNSGLFASILVTIKKLVNGFNELAEPITGFKDGILKIIDGVKDSLSAYQRDLKAGTLLKIAASLAILAASLLALSLIDSGRLAGALSGVSVLLGELMASMLVLNKLSSDKQSVKNINKLVAPMVRLSVAVLILAIAMKKIGNLDFSSIVKGLIGIAGAAGVLVVSASQLSKNSGKMAKGATGLIIFSAAIVVLAKAVEKLGALEVGNLTKGLIGVGVLVAELALFMKVTDLSKMGLLKGAGLLALAGSISILASAVKQFSSMNPGALMQGLLSVGAVLTELIIFTKLTGNANKVMSTAIGLTILAGAMKILASVIKTFGTMSIEQLGKGLITLGIALGILAAAMYLMKGSVAGAGGMFVMASSLALLVPQLMLLSMLSLNEIGTGLLALAGAFAVIGIAGIALGPLTPVLLSLSGVIALLGVGFLAVGAGLVAFSAGLSSLAVSGVAGVAALVTILTTIIGIIPMILVQIGNAIVAFANVIIQGAPAIGAAITSVILSVIQILVLSIPEIVNAGLELLFQLLTALLNYIPNLMDVGVKIIIAILDGISKHIGEIVEKGIEIIVNFINGVSSMLGDIIQAGITLIINFINGLADGIRENGPDFIDAIWNLFDSIVEVAMYILSSSIGNITKIGGKIIKGLTSGISSMISGVVATIRKIVNKIISTFKSYISKFTSIGSNIVSGLVKGITGGISSIVDAASSLASGALSAAKKFLGIASPSKEFAKVGMYADQGLAKGLKQYAKLAGSAAESVGDKTLNALVNSLSGIELDLTESQPVIRPVLDLTNVKAGTNAINGLFSNNQKLSLGTDVDTNFLGRTLGSVSSMMNNQNGTNKDIIKAIEDLRNDVGYLAEAMSGMQMVTDTGALVGEITNKMDKALGVLTTHKGRGN